MIGLGLNLWWAALGGGEYNYLILDDLGPLLLAEGDYLILE